MAGQLSQWDPYGGVKVGSQGDTPPLWPANSVDGTHMSELRVVGKATLPHLGRLTQSMGPMKELRVVGKATLPQWGRLTQSMEGGR